MAKITQKIRSFFEEVVTEGKKVDWPRRKEALNNTIIVIGITLGVALFLGVMDFLFLEILSKVIL